MDIYEGQMEAITDLLRTINAWEKRHGDELMIGNAIPLKDLEDDDSVYGHLVDEIGGVWAFRPAGEDEP